MYILKNKKTAFTIIEMLVVLAIFALMSSVVMISYGKFGKKTELKNLAYNIALTLREAQASGLTGRDIKGQGSSVSYGVYFKSSSFIFFADRNNNYRYDGVSEKEREFRLPKAFRFTRFCYAYRSTCVRSSELHITFRRPEPDAYIYTAGSGPYAAADIELVAPSGYRLHLIVESTGQISVQKNGL